MEKNEALAFVLANSLDEVIMTIYNEYANEYGESPIYKMDSFDEVNKEKTPTEIVEGLDRDFCIGHDYFIEDNGYFTSSFNINDLVCLNNTFEEVAEFMAENWQTIGSIIGYNAAMAIETEVEEKFEEWAEEHGEKDVVDGISVDATECIERDWEEYLEELKSQYDE